MQSSIKKRVAGLLLVTLSSLFIGYLIGVKTSLSPAVTDVTQKNGSASLMLDFGDGLIKTYRNINVTGSTTLFALTEELTKNNNLAFETKEYKGLGVLIEKIGEKKNGVGNRYWPYWVNNVSVQVGAGEYQVKAGAVIEWKFIPYAQE